MEKRAEGTCGICGRRITGHNNKEVMFNMGQHLGKHRRKEARKKNKESRKWKKQKRKNI